jgi:hypothetical protein
MALPVYSSRDVSIAWSGQKLDGLAPDSFVSFSLNSDLTEEETGADGQVNISRLPDNTGTCTLSFQQNSTSNLILSGILAAQQNSPTFITGSLTVVDPSGSVIALMTNAHIKTAPEVTLGSSATGATRDWIFFCETVNYTSVPEGVSVVTAEAALVAGAVLSILGNV